MATRAVLDTNVVLAAHHSRNPASPGVEILDRWERGEFVLLYTADVITEYAEKLIEAGAPQTATDRFLSAIALNGTFVLIEFFHFRHYPEDTDDIAFLLCALNGDATHLVTYDPHLHVLQPHYALAICEPLRFLADLRSA